MVNNVDKTLRSFYTNSDSIVQYMVGQLSFKPGMKVLEPCAGNGIFIDEILSKVNNIDIDAYELDPKAAKILKNKYKNHGNVKIKEGDTLNSQELLESAKEKGTYDRIIANPPYGGWQDYKKRILLKKLYNGLYVKETYTLFLYLCTHLLKDDGILVFIIPDTFLNLHRHTILRRILLTGTKVKEICLFPTHFFPGIHFAYSNMCIITLNRNGNREECLSNTIKVITGLQDVKELGSVGLQKFNHLKIYKIKQKTVFNNIDHALFLNAKQTALTLLKNSRLRIGQIAECVTGFYSGNDKKYLKQNHATYKKSKRYGAIDSSKINTEYKKNKIILDGLTGNKTFLPIVKGGSIPFYKPPIWFMDWSKETVNVYKKHEKARFQNSDYYFKLGIGIPMVSSTRISAALIENNLFDQSIVGVFPHDPKLLNYLLAFFNSATCNTLIRMINPTANNSANYVKKIPFIQPTNEQLKKINNHVDVIIKTLKKEGKIKENAILVIDNIFYAIYGFK